MMMMMSGGMIDTKICDGVAFPISMCLRELEPRLKKKMKERDEDGWEGRRKVREGVELGEDSIW